MLRSPLARRVAPGTSSALPTRRLGPRPRHDRPRRPPQELLALGEAAGHVSRSASNEAIAALPESSFDEAKRAQCGDAEQCAVCRMEFELGDVLSTLPCKHFYHKE